jgi:hypothetical protein
MATAANDKDRSRLPFTQGEKAPKQKNRPVRFTMNRTGRLIFES